MEKLLGRKVRDIITGYAGIVTGYVRYLTGCNQVLVVPRIGKDGKRDNGEWFDVQRIVRVGESRIVLPNADVAIAAIGPDAEPPKTH